MRMATQPTRNKLRKTYFLLVLNLINLHIVQYKEGFVNAQKPHKYAVF